MRKKYLHGLMTGLLLLGFAQLRSQTILDITSLNTTQLNGTTPTNGICPGGSYELLFNVTLGSVNPFATINVFIVDTNNPFNPINNTSVGDTSFNFALAAGATGIPIFVDIPFNIPAGDYLFYLVVNAASVTPPPFSSDTTDAERTRLQLPRATMILDTSAITGNTNIFRTDSGRVLRSFDPITGFPIPGGEDVVLSTPVPQPTDSTINFCKGDSLYLWNPDSLLSNTEHVWYRDGAQISPPNSNLGHLWVTDPGYYALRTINSSTCDDSTAYIGVGRPGFGGSITRGVSGIYFHSYDVDTALNRIGVGNAVGKPTRFCHGDSVIIAARQTSSHPLGYYEYQWVANGTDSISTDYRIIVKQPGSFEVYITEIIDSSFTCQVKSNLVQVEVDPLPGSEIGTAGATICFGDTIVVQDTNTYVPSNIYTWFANGQNLLGVFGDTNFVKIDTTLLATLGIGPDTSLFMTLVVTDTLGCDSLSTPVVFDFQLYPDIALSTNDTIGLCVGDSVIVSAFTTNGVSSVFTWYDLPGNNTVSTNANFKVLTDGTYWVEAIGPNGCAKSDTLYVFDLTINANAGPNQVVDSGAVVQLGATGGVDYYWYASSPVYFNNPFDPNAQTIPTQDTTIYYVEVVGANGCSDLDSMFVFVRPRVPDPLEGIANTQNVITPNGDGVNDALDLSRIMDGASCEFRVMNRWGSEVYLDSGYDNSWEGQDSGGNLLPDGTYYYTLRCPGDDFRLKAAVTILSGSSN